MTPDVDEAEIEDANELQRQMGKFKRSIELRFKSLENIINRQTGKELQTLKDETKSRFLTMEKDQKLKHSSLSQSLRSINKRTHEIDTNVQDEVEQCKAEIKKELHQEIINVKDGFGEMKNEMSDLKREFKGDIDGVKIEV